ncbi:hypothetical protein NHH03_02395 [Stieleria sp. TO1_6]|nr:hypothetical protein [Stieleria tagensis]
MQRLEFGSANEVREHLKQGTESPMIFYGEDYWKFRKPIYPVLVVTAAAREYGRKISITDDRTQIVDTIKRFSEVVTN